MKSLANDLVVTYNGIVYTPESALIDPGDGMNHSLIAVVLLSIACLLMFVAIIIKYYRKQGFKIVCLLLC